jgi:hypothetical protein
MSLYGAASEGIGKGLAALGRVSAGAAIGGYMGSDNGSSGFWSGMAAGAAMGGWGPGLGRKLMGMNNVVGRGLSGIGAFATGPAASMGGAWLAQQGAALSAMTTNRALQYGASLISRTGGMLANPAWQGRAMLGMGIASAAGIGSSIIGTNRGY